MIVRPAPGGLHLITQPDHAHAAGRVMERCRPLATHPRRDDVLHAIAQHDNGWEEVDAAPTVDAATGRVADFINIPVPVRHAVWPRAVDRLRDRPWAAALVAQHAITVYDRYRPDPEWEAFFHGLEATRDELLRGLGTDLEELLPDYAFVRLADLISLTFCTGWTDEQRFGDWTVQLSGASVVVTPDAFGGEEVAFEIGATEVQGTSFASDADLRHALLQARATVLRGHVRGRDG